MILISLTLVSPWSCDLDDSAWPLNPDSSVVDLRPSTLTRQKDTFSRFNGKHSEVQTMMERSWKESEQHVQRIDIIITIVVIIIIIIIVVITIIWIGRLYRDAKFGLSEHHYNNHNHNNSNNHHHHHHHSHHRHRHHHHHHHHHHSHHRHHSTSPF